MVLGTTVTEYYSNLRAKNIGQCKFYLSCCISRLLFKG